MCPDKANLQVSEKLALLKKEYFELLPEKMAEIEAIWHRVDLRSAEQFSVLDELYRYIHNLMGTAGTFGAEQLSNSAKELLQCLRTVLDSENTISQLEYDLIEQLIAKVKKQSQIK